MPNAVRDRLIQAALQLFIEKGLSRVGINEITLEADVARMSLYNNFSSKEDLAIAAYSTLSQDRQTTISEAISASRSPQEAVRTIFDIANLLAQKSEFYGCAFLNLSSHVEGKESPLLALVRDHKAALRDRFTQLAEAQGHEYPEIVGRQVLALWDGSITDAFIEGNQAPITAACSAAEKLLGDKI